MSRIRLAIMTAILIANGVALEAAELRAGVAKVEITDLEAGPVNDPLFAKALVLQSGDSVLALITIDAVAIGEIGRIGDDFLPQVRQRLKAELEIPPSSVVINASHCHGVVRADVADLTVLAVREAWRRREPVKAGAGVGRENRISENRRLRMKDGSEVDMRRAYSLPADADVASVGPIDPEIGLLRVDRLDGKPLAVLYNFACHPIMNPPHMGNSADFPGFASRLIEESLGEGAVAMFVQGCCGDINPVRYKTVLNPTSAEPLGYMLGMSVLQAARKIETEPDAALNILSEVVSLPRGVDLEQRIAAIEAEQTQLVKSLRPTDINFKTFLPLLIQHGLSPDSPAFYAQGYLHDAQQARDDLTKLDAANRKSIEAYLQNIQAMERLTRLNVNLALLRKHLAQNKAAGSPTLEVEIIGLRVGEFSMICFTGEPTVEVGLRIKERAQRPLTFVAGYTNGYIYYLPTETQRRNTGYAQEDCDCLVAPEWREMFESRALKILSEL